MEKNKQAWEQFCKLGEAIGEGLHDEDPSILTSYKLLQKNLFPDTSEEKAYKKTLRINRNKAIDKAISERVLIDKCKCGHSLKQIRSGSFKVKCVESSCQKKYSYRQKKTKK